MVSRTFIPVIGPLLKQLDYSVLFGPSPHNLCPRRPTSVTLLWDCGQKEEQTFSRVHVSNMRWWWGVAELEMETNPVWNGPPGQSTRSVLKGKHITRLVESSLARDLQEEENWPLARQRFNLSSPPCCFPAIMRKKSSQLRSPTCTHK